MRIASATLHALDIPFKLSFAHAKASRHKSDSFIVEIRDEQGHSGYGEVVARDYVTGMLGEDAEDDTKLCAAAAALQGILRPFAKEDLQPDMALNLLSEVDVPHPSLPLLCAAETAILDLMCASANVDGYELIGMEPVRETVQYGGIIPLVSTETREWFIKGYKEVGLPFVKIKVGGDGIYNRGVLTRAREIFGEDFDIRVDANFAWDISTAAEHLNIMRECGVRSIEEPVEKSREEMKKLCALPEASGMTFIADESCLDAEDLRQMADDGTFTMVNLRLAKNGGVFRCLALADEATKLGISYHLASLVGETGILSAMGRFVSSLLPEPKYVDGSFDSYLLSGNVTEENVDFGPKGISPIFRNKGMGFRVNTANLSSFTIQIRQIL